MEAYEFFSQHQRGEQSDCIAAKVKGTVPRDQAWFSRFFSYPGSHTFPRDGGQVVYFDSFHLSEVNGINDFHFLI